MQRAATQLTLFPAAEAPDELSGFSVRESGRARRLSIKVYPRGRVEVVVPRRTRPQEVRAFVEAHREWINDTRAAFAAEHTAEPFALPTRVHLPGVERSFRVSYERHTGGTGVAFRQQPGLVRLSGTTRDEAACVDALRRWLLGLARKEYTPRLRALSGLTGNPYKALHVRGQKTCWGSHSSSGTISLNVCALFLPPELVRYLLLHELCHGRHMNHSRRFWALLERFAPGCKALDRRLGESWRDIPGWVNLY